MEPTRGSFIVYYVESTINWLSYFVNPSHLDHFVSKQTKEQIIKYTWLVFGSGTCNSGCYLNKIFRTLCKI